jgi:phosphotransferase system enzyme I (PtsI)
MTFLQGIAASNGIAIAKAYRLVEPNLSFEKQTIEDADSEVSRFKEAIEKSKAELEAIRDRAQVELGADKAAIFEAHLLVLTDPELNGPIEDKIKSEKVNAEAALKDTADMFVMMFEQMDNEYMKERAPIFDVTKRVLSFTRRTISKSKYDR